MQIKYTIAGINKVTVYNFSFHDSNATFTAKSGPCPEVVFLRPAY